VGRDDFGTDTIGPVRVEIAGLSYELTAALVLNSEDGMPDGWYAHAVGQNDQITVEHKGLEGFATAADALVGGFANIVDAVLTLQEQGTP
jgi:hypothetical protein